MTIPLTANFIDETFNFNNLYVNDEWEPQTLQILRRFLYPESLFIDVGAWIGPVTLWACTLGAHVIALEPDLVARDSLYLNTTGQPVTIVPKALSSHNGTSRLGNPRFYGDSQSRITQDPTDHIIDTITIESLLVGLDPALIKIDIEGHEQIIIEDVLRICRSRGIPVLVAWHEPWWVRPRQDAGFWEQITRGFDLEGDPIGGWGQTLFVPT